MSNLQCDGLLIKRYWLEDDGSWSGPEIMMKSFDDMLPQDSVVWGYFMGGKAVFFTDKPASESEVSYVLKMWHEKCRHLPLEDLTSFWDRITYLLEG